MLSQLSYLLLNFLVLKAVECQSNITFPDAPAPPLYLIKYPAQNDGATLFVNYKDTIELTWYEPSYAPQDPPRIQIECWDQTTNHGGISPLGGPQLIQNVTTVTDPDIFAYNVSMEAYKGYNPCLFTFIDSVNATLAEWLPMNTNYIQIKQDDKPKAEFWSGRNQAPLTSDWQNTTKGAAPSLNVNGLFVLGTQVLCVGMMSIL